MPKTDKNINDLLINYLSNNLNDNDIKYVFQWIKESEENKITYDQVKRIWNNKTTKGGKKYGWNKLLKRMKTREPKPILQKPHFTRIAAVIMLLIGIVGYLNVYHKSSKEVFSTNNNFLSDTLKNGSILYLYPSSELIQTNNNEYVLNGEAFFVIPEKTANSISISMGDAKINVCGTSFRAKSCTNSSNISITVESGNVELSNKNKPKDSLKINAGEQGYYSCNQHNLWKHKNNENIYIIYQPQINLN